MNIAPKTVTLRIAAPEPDPVALLLSTAPPTPPRPRRPLPSLRESLRNHAIDQLHAELVEQGAAADVVHSLCREAQQSLADIGLAADSLTGIRRVNEVIDRFRQRGVLANVSPFWSWDGGARSSPLAKPLTADHAEIHRALRDAFANKCDGSAHDARHFADQLVHSVRHLDDFSDAGWPQIDQAICERLDEMKSRGLLRDKPTVEDYRSQFASILDGGQP